MAQGPCWCNGLEMLSTTVRYTEELNLKISVLPLLVMSPRRILAPTEEDGSISAISLKS